MIKLLIVDGQEDCRGELLRALGDHADLPVLAQTSSYLHALRAAATLDIDLAIVELMMDGHDGFELIRGLRKLRPFMKVLVNSVRRDAATVTRAQRMGAGGYMAKGGDPKDIIAAIRAVASGQLYLCPSIAQAMLLVTPGKSAYTRSGDANGRPATGYEATRFQTGR